MAESSRVNKYKELRESMKDEAGVQRDIGIKEDVVQDDDFLQFIPKTPSIEEDTLVEAIVFDQLKETKDQEVDRVLRSVKTSTGKEEYNTRLDILSKIRTPSTSSVHVVDDEATSSFEMGHFTASPKEEPEALPKMSLMERLSLMSPKEDVKKVQEVLNKQEEIKKEEPKAIIKEEPVIVAKQQEETVESTIIPIFKKDTKIKKEEKDEEIVEKEEETPIIKVLNYIIVALVIVFVVLCGMIVSQIFM